jgi:hypothetical protein
MTTRWRLHDPVTDETWIMPINPNTMTSPHPQKSLATAYGTRRGTDRIRTFMTPEAIVSWEWGGVIRSKEHYDELVRWSRKPGEVHVTDHFGRTWVVVFEKVVPTDRVPTANVPWRLRYTMRSMILREVQP